MLTTWVTTFALYWIMYIGSSTKEPRAVKVHVLKVNDAKAIGPEVMLHVYLLSLNQHTTSPISALLKKRIHDISLTVCHTSFWTPKLVKQIRSQYCPFSELHLCDFHSLFTPQGIKLHSTHCCYVMVCWTHLKKRSPECNFLYRVYPDYWHTWFEALTRSQPAACVVWLSKVFSEHGRGGEQRVKETRYGHYWGRRLTIVASLQATVSDHTADQGCPPSLARHRLYQEDVNLTSATNVATSSGSTRISAFTLLFCSLLHLRSCALFEHGLPQTVEQFFWMLNVHSVVVDGSTLMFFMKTRKSEIANMTLHNILRIYSLNKICFCFFKSSLSVKKKRAASPSYVLN